jgi:hypothetical protein
VSTKIIRHGDVFIILDAGGQDPNAKPRRDRTLALGEATGHTHTLTAGTVYGELAGRQWIVLDEPAELKHQEHDTLVIPPGVHEVRIQREYHPEEIRRVMD